jgi:hydroxymethylbilane synthase
MYRLATRGSRLALKQSGMVQSMLKELAGLESELMIVKTTGDRVCDVPLSEITGTGFFTKEIGQALYAKDADLAVHSLKDLPIEQPSGLTLAAIVKRENPAEVIVTLPKNIDDQKPLNLRQGLTIGTSAIRRKAQIKAVRSDLKVKDLRGNVTTRLQKVRDGEYDAVMIAYAGLLRVDANLDGLEIRVLDISEFVPAPAQGALAVEVRSDDREVYDKAVKINDVETVMAVNAERRLLLLCGGGCHLPLGVNVSKVKNQWRINVFWAHNLPDGAEKYIHFNLASDNLDDLVRSAYAKLQSIEINNLLTSFGKGPKAKRRLLITRSAQKSIRLVSMLKEKNIELQPYPILTFNDLYNEQAWENIKSGINDYDYLIFTSVNAVEIFGGQMEKAEISADDFWVERIAAVGEKAAMACRQLFPNTVIIVSPQATGEGLAKYLAEMEKTAHPRALFPCAREAGNMLEVILAHAGWSVVRMEIYETLAEKPENLPEIVVEDLDYICFTSSLAVEYTCGYVDIPDNVVIISIGPRTSEKIRAMGKRVDWEIPNSDLEWLWQAL